MLCTMISAILCGFVEFGRFQRRYTPKTHLTSRFLGGYGTSLKECHSYTISIRPAPAAALRLVCRLQAPHAHLPP